MKAVVLHEVDGPLTVEGGRELRDVSATLDDLPRYAEGLGDAYLRVKLQVDGPVPGIADRVREILPNTLDVTLDYERTAQVTLGVAGAVRGTAG